MLIPISLVWFHIILVIFFYFLGRSVSKFIEPVIVDNIMKESYNVKTPLVVLGILIIANLLAIAFSRNYIPTFEVLSKLASSLDNSVAIRIMYLLLHSLSFFFLPIILRFLVEEYEYKFFVWGAFLLMLIGILHFCIFSFNLILYVAKS